MKFDGEKFEECGRGDKAIEEVFNEKMTDIEESELDDAIKIASDETYTSYEGKTEDQKNNFIESMYKPMYNNREIPKKTNLKLNI